MEKEFIPYEQALELKELGLDVPCFGYYVDGEIRGINLGYEEFGGVKPYYQRFGFHTITNNDIDNSSKVVVSTPLYQQAFRWFREKYGLYSMIDVDQTMEPKFCYTLSRYKGDFRWDNILPSYSELYYTYEEAELACLKKLIEIVKNK